MGLKAGQLVGPLPPWTLNLPDSFEITETDWSNRLVKSDDATNLPVAGAFMIRGAIEGGDTTAIIPYKWGKKGTLLRGIPKLVLVGAVFNEEEVSTIRAAVEDDCKAANTMVIFQGTFLGNGLIFPDSSDTVIDTIETEYTKQLDPFRGELDPYTDYTSVLPWRLDTYEFDVEKWTGYSVLSIEGHLTQFSESSFFDDQDKPNIYQWPRFTNFHPDEEVSDNAGFKPTSYVTYDFNTILGWADVEPFGEYQVQDIPYNVYLLDEQKEADKEAIAAAYSEDIYEEIVVKCLNCRATFDVSFDGTALDPNDGDEFDPQFTDPDDIWVPTFEALQQEVMDAQSAGLQEVYESIGAEYAEIEFGPPSTMYEYSQDRVDLIIGWIREFIGVE